MFNWYKQIFLLFTNQNNIFRKREATKYFDYVNNNIKYV